MEAVAIGAGFDGGDGGVAVDRGAGVAGRVGEAARVFAGVEAKPSGLVTAPWKGPLRPDWASSSGGMMVGSTP